MRLVGIAKTGFGKALKAHTQRKMRKGTSTRSERLKYGDRGPTIKSVKPGVGGLKASRKSFESMQESASAERQLSETALVISEDNFKVKEADEKLNENHANHGNEWINQGVLEKLNSYRG